MLRGSSVKIYFIFLLGKALNVFFHILRQSSRLVLLAGDFRDDKRGTLLTSAVCVQYRVWSCGLFVEDLLEGPPVVQVFEDGACWQADVNWDVNQRPRDEMTRRSFSPLFHVPFNVSKYNLHVQTFRNRNQAVHFRRLIFWLLFPHCYVKNQYFILHIFFPPH